MLAGCVALNVQCQRLLHLLPTLTHGYEQKGHFWAIKNRDCRLYTCICYGVEAWLGDWEVKHRGELVRFSGSGGFTPISLDRFGFGATVV